MYLVFTERRPFNFQFYISFAQAKSKERRNLPSPYRQIMKIADGSEEAVLREKLNARMHTAHQLPLFPDEERELIEKYAAFTEANADALKDAPSRAGSSGDNPRLHLYLPKEITIYTDGAFSENFGGYAAVFLEAGRPFASLSGSGLFASNIEVDWKAVDAALAAIEGNGHQVHVYTDCLIIVQSLYGGTPPEGESPQKLYHHILACSKENSITFHHVRSHGGFDGSEWNELADVLAKHEKDRLKASVASA